MWSSSTWRRGLSVLGLVVVLGVGVERVALATDWGAILGGLAVGAIVYEALDDEGKWDRGDHYWDYGYRGGRREHGGWDAGYGYGWGGREPVSRAWYGWDSGYDERPRPPRRYGRPRARTQIEFRGGWYDGGPDYGWGW